MILYERQVRYGQKWIIKFAYILARGDGTSYAHCLYPKFQNYWLEELAMEKKKRKDKRSTFFLLRLGVNTTVISESRTSIICSQNNFKPKKNALARSHALRA